MSFKPVKRNRNSVQLIPDNMSNHVYTDSILERRLEKLMRLNLNVLLSGRHGAGKTSLIEAVAARCGLVMGYYSVPNTDPFADLAGIPIVDRKTKTIEFSFNHLLDQYDIIFFDELNRMQHPKMQGAFLELLQKHSINGYKFSKLKMVWAAQNPPNQEYIVDDLDPTVIDRFHVFINLSQRPDRAFFVKKFSENIANVLINWWDQLAEDQRKHVSPRRLEYVCNVAIQSGFDVDIIRSCFVPGTVTVSNINVLITQLKPELTGNGSVSNNGDGLMAGYINGQKNGNTP